MASGRSDATSSLVQELSEDATSMLSTIFLHFVQKRGCVSFSEVIEFLKDITSFRVTEERLESIRQELNRELAADDFEIRRLTYPMDNKIYVAFVNTQADSITQSLSKYGQSPELELFKQLMEAILLSGEVPEIGGCISEVQIVQIGRGRHESSTESAPMNFDHETSLNLLESLINDGWISRVADKEDYYCLGVRALMEFHHQILQMDLPEETFEHLRRIL